MRKLDIVFAAIDEMGDCPDELKEIQRQSQ